MGWTCWIVTTKQLKPWDVEWMLGHFEYWPRSDAEWYIDMDGGTRIDVKLVGPDYTSKMPSTWIQNQEKALSKPLRRARLQSFIAMNYYDRAELDLPDATPAVIASDTQAAWFQCVQLARFAVEEAGWPGVLCQPDPQLQNLRILHPADT